jgi:hypothetical protein
LLRNVSYRPVSDVRFTHPSTVNTVIAGKVVKRARWFVPLNRRLKPAGAALTVNVAVAVAVPLTLVAVSV